MTIKDRVDMYITVPQYQDARWADGDAEQKATEENTGESIGYR